jgi:hypothetical protein
MNLERTILTNLERGHHGMMATGTLWSEVGLDVPGSTYTDFKKALRELELKEQVVVIPGEDRQKAKITDLGRARLLES